MLATYCSECLAEFEPYHRFQRTCGNDSCKRKNRVKNAQRSKDKHKDKYQATARRNYLNDRERFRTNHLKHRYGANAVEHYSKQLGLQNNVCAICHNPFPRVPCQDHNHHCCNGYKSCGKCLRGLLCNHCNNGLHFLENEQWQHNALEYLASWVKC